MQPPTTTSGCAAWSTWTTRQRTPSWQRLPTCWNSSTRTWASPDTMTSWTARWVLEISFPLLRGCNCGTRPDRKQSCMQLPPCSSPTCRRCLRHPGHPESRAKKLWGSHNTQLRTHQRPVHRHLRSPPLPEIQPQLLLNRQTLNGTGMLFFNELLKPCHGTMEPRFQTPRHKHSSLSPELPQRDRMISDVQSVVSVQISFSLGSNTNLIKCKSCFASTLVCFPSTLRHPTVAAAPQEGTSIWQGMEQGTTILGYSTLLG